MHVASFGLAMTTLQIACIENNRIPCNMDVYQKAGQHKWLIHVYSVDHATLAISSIISKPCLINSLWLNDAIQQQRSGSTLAQVMAWCRHQCWTNVDLSSVRSCTIHLRFLSKEALKVPISKTSLKIEFLKLHPNPPGINELNVLSGFLRLEVPCKLAATLTFSVTVIFKV